MLEEWQYEALRSQAERQGKSMSELLRSMLDTVLDQVPSTGAGLEEIRGIGADGTARGRHHDQFLYGKKPGRR